MAEEQTGIVEKSATPAQEAKNGYWWGTGRRKTSVARVRIKPGEGKIVVNDREATVYFTELGDQKTIVSPLEATNTLGKVDVFVNVNGGGFTGQSDAVKMGVARALKAYDPALEPILRDHDFLSRDSRKVERKKPGRPGARKRFQFSKR